MALLEVSHLKKYFQVSSGILHAVDDVSFTLEQGKTLGVVGESGCGKSTLGKTIIRLTHPTAGKVVFDGEDVAAYTPKEFKKVRPDMQMIFQDPFASLDPRRTVTELIAEPMKIYKTGSKDEIYKRVKDLMETEIISVSTHTDQEEVAQLFTKYDLLALPVLDQDGLMVGIVTVDDAMDVMVDEATEDITKMAAMSPSEKNYFETSVFDHARHRIVWLLILMFSATITGTIITKYEDAFAAIPLLVSFIPMLMDTGGNCGSQSATLIIRGIALGEIQFKDIFRVIFKEFRVSLIVSVVLALANGVRILIMYKDVSLALVIGLSLIGTVIISKLIGCVLPLLAKKVRLDPAIMASPLITTLVDTCSILIYFNIATMLFNL